MTVSPVYTVWCDEEGCLEWHGQEATQAEARKAAKNHNWRRVRRDGRLLDICPRHGR